MIDWILIEVIFKINEFSQTYREGFLLPSIGLTLVLLIIFLLGVSFFKGYYIFWNSSKKKSSERSRLSLLQLWRGAWIEQVWKIFGAA